MLAIKIYSFDKVRANSVHRLLRLTCGFLVFFLMTGVLPEIQAREWGDATGKYRVQAELVEVKDDVVKLRRADGVILSVSMKDLSKVDRDYIKSVSQAGSLRSDDDVRATGGMDDIDQVLSRLDAVGNQDLRREIVACQRRAKEKERGYVAVGCIELPSGSSRNQVFCQRDLLPGGYFVDVIQSPGIPIYFWIAGYKRITVMPEYIDGMATGSGPIVLLLPKQKFVRRDQNQRVVSGRLVDIMGEIPKGIKASVAYSLPLMNSFESGESLFRRFLPLFSHRSDEQLKINHDSGNFSFSDFPDIPCSIRFTSERNEYFSMDFDQQPEVATNLGECQMKIAQNQAARDWAMQNSQPLPPSRHPNEEIEKILQSLEGDRSARREFETDLKRNLDEQKKYAELKKPSVVVVGKISAGEHDPNEIYAQILIPPSGYFSTLAVPGIPMGFRLHGFDPLNYVPKNTGYEIDYAGELHMVPTKPADFGTLKGSVIIEAVPENSVPPTGSRTATKRSRISTGRSKDLKTEAPAITALAMHSLYSRPSNTEEYPGIPGRRPSKLPSVPIPSATFEGDAFILEKLSPIRHNLFVTFPGMHFQECSVHLSPGETRERQPFQLFRERQVKITYLATENHDFREAKLHVVSCGTNSPRIHYGAHLSSRPNSSWKYYQTDGNLRQQGDSVYFAPFFHPAVLACLGNVDLEACCRITRDNVPAGADFFGKLKLQEGCVYYLEHNFGYRVLFRVDEIR